MTRAGTVRPLPGVPVCHFGSVILVLLAAFVVAFVASACALFQSEPMSARGQLPLYEFSKLA